MVVLRAAFTVRFASLLGCSLIALTQSFSSPHKLALTADVQYMLLLLHLWVTMWDNSTFSTIKLVWQ